MITWLTTQRTYFWLALAFFTRLPIPAKTPFSNELLNHASRYFSLVGWVVGAVALLTLGGAALLFPLSIAVLLSMVATLKITGAFHEDGLADMSDGLGGGMSRERKLEIMKDSRLGSYGSLALIMALFIKFVALHEISTIALSEGMLSLLCLHAASRALAGSLIFDMAYVRDEPSKAKPLAQDQDLGDLLWLLLWGLLPLLLLAPSAAITLCLAGLMFRFGFKRWLNRQIGGYTGDCLGAAQQLAELGGYLLLLLLQQQQIALLSPWFNQLIAQVWH
ncbi:MAG: adenosylcobinamide-GDP ribazoletransferase [Aeromonadaceae bacterium]